MQAITDWSKNLRVEVRGDDVGSTPVRLPRMLADATGLTQGLSAAVSRPEVTHDRGGVLRTWRYRSATAAATSPMSSCWASSRGCSGRWRRSPRCGGR